MRLGTWLVFADGIPDRETLLDYLLNPGGLFLDPTFLIATAVALVMWRLGVQLSALFYDLEISEFELRYYSLPLAQRKAQADDQPIRRGRSESASNFARTWLWGGIFLTVTIAFSRFDGGSWQETLLAPLASGRASLEPGLLAALLAYFLIGLFLLSQARLMEMDARWLLNGVNKDATMRRTWQRTSLAILAGIALFAAFLPIGSTSALSQLVNLLLIGLLFLVNVLIFAFTLPFALILALLSRNSDAAALPPPPLEPRLPFQTSQDAITPVSETVTMVLSSAFWTLLIAGAVLALLFFLRERRRRVEGEEPAQLWAQFTAWLAAVWLRFRGRVAALQLSSPPPGTPSAPPAGFSERLRRRLRRLEGLSPREQIRAIYLTAVQHAATAGVPRDPTETPSEFAQDLQHEWPDAEEELQRLTAAFLQARYSDEALDASDVPPVKETWRALQREMSRRREAEDAAPGDDKEAT